MTPTIPFYFAALLATLIPAALAVAQLEDAPTPQQEEQRWYKVELLVFSHESNATADAEQWEPTPRLVYPGQQVRFLVDEELYAAREAEYLAASRTDELGRQILFDAPDPADGSGDNEEQPVAVDASSDEQSSPISPISPISPAAPALPTPFVTLGKAHQDFAGKASRMRRGGRYSVLFHESWVQPMATESTALSLVVDRSGDGGDWPRLQGSIKMYLSRYLHVQTNLWLNNPGDYLPGSWQMPAPPLAPLSLLGDELTDFEEKKQALLDAMAPPASDLPAAGMNSTVMPPSDAPPGVPVPGMPTGLPAAPGTPSPAETYGDPMAELEDPGPPYPYRHAVLLQQSRRMRSNEVHYIDHPMLGVILKFTPLAEEDLELLASSEASSLDYAGDQR